jgi:hypothetical protein
MNNIENASSQHILISYSEYERLKNIEEEFQKMQKQVHQKLLIPSKNLVNTKLKLILRL